MPESTTVREAPNLYSLFGFPEDAAFSLVDSHFYLDDHRYPAFCAAMQRAHQWGLGGTTQQEVAAAWHARLSSSPRELSG
jgi:hypothetical protein